MTRVLLAVLLFASTCPAQGARIFIITDMEGVGGVNDREEQVLPGQRRFPESQRLLTGEINAAVQGAVTAGATEIVIWDGHDGSRSLSIDEIHPAAKLIQGKPTPANYYLAPRLYDGIMFIGQHAMAGTQNGLIAHSQSHSIKRITINGKEAGEIGQIVAIGGYFDIPVIMLAGDQAACDEFLGYQPKAPTVAVKRLAGKASSLSLSHAEARRRIESAAREAVLRVKEFKPWKLAGPVEMVFEFLPQPPERPAGRSVTYRGATVLEAFEAWLGKP
jgi:D-amino peptidase